MSPPLFSSALSTDPEPSVAEQRCLAAALDALGGAQPDLLLAFVTHHYGSALEGLGQRLMQASGAHHVAGCTGASIIAGAREVEHKPALALWAAVLPDTDVRTTHVRARSEPEGGWAFTAQPEVHDADRASLLLFGDGFSFPMPDYLRHLGQVLPGVPALGGMASGGQGPGQNLLFHDGKVLADGAIAVSLEGEVELSSMVSQGCRPIGAPHVITACEGHVILKLRRRGAAKVMFEMLEEVSEGDRELFRRGPFAGLAIDPTKSAFRSGDLLVRNVMGLQPQDDGVVVADSSIRIGQTIQFMVRDSESAAAELNEVLTRRAREWATPAREEAEQGGLLFSCGGRGTRMFSSVDHDAGCLQRALGPGLPVAGFFADGEIGPVGGQNFLHGFTASIGLLRRRP